MNFNIKQSILYKCKIFEVGSSVTNSCKGKCVQIIVKKNEPIFVITGYQMLDFQINISVYISIKTGIFLSKYTTNTIVFSFNVFLNQIQHRGLTNA